MSPSQLALAEVRGLTVTAPISLTFFEKLKDVGKPAVQ